jgi:hypothetical protein
MTGDVGLAATLGLPKRGILTGGDAAGGVAALAGGLAGGSTGGDTTGGFSVGTGAGAGRSEGGGEPGTVTTVGELRVCPNSNTTQLAATNVLSPTMTRDNL